MNVSFQSSNTGSNNLVVGVKDDTFLGTAQNLDTETQGALKRALDNNKWNEDVMVVLSPVGVEHQAIILLNLSNTDDKDYNAVQELGAKLYSAVSHFNQVVVDIGSDLVSNHTEYITNLAAGMQLRSWRFNKYKTQKKAPEVLEEITFLTDDDQAASEEFETLNAIIEGVFLTRTVVSEPPNVIYPESMGEVAESLTALGLGVEILDEEDMRNLGMNALLGVGQGSIRESRLIVLKWLNGPQDQAPIAIVGKGVTFDTGGISIKPSAKMEDMKADMGGSAVVLGLMKSLALRNAKVNVVGVMGMAENMPSGSAQRPADVVTSMSGQTIEIINTDAEGRLVLADALWYTQDRFDPQVMINLATLTGAINIALGEEYAGLFSNNDTLAEQLFESGKATGEQVWRLPLGEAYDRDIDSEIADMKNTGSGRGAGSITAAQFLQRFVNEVPWAHLDIASMAWMSKNRSLAEKGASGFGVRLLNDFLSKNYE